MKYMGNSEINFVPDHSRTWAVDITQGGRPLRLPVIGWATVVQGVRDDGAISAYTEPVALLGGHLLTDSTFGADYGSDTSYDLVVIDEDEWFRLAMSVGQSRQSDSVGSTGRDGS